MPLLCHCEGSALPPEAIPSRRWRLLPESRNDVCDVDKINRPSRLRRAILFDLSVCQLAKLRPTICAIVIIVIIIGEVELVLHGVGIIAQSYDYEVNRLSANWTTIRLRREQ
jgi:hypothetical protein